MHQILNHYVQLKSKEFNEDVLEVIKVLMRGIGGDDDQNMI